MRRRELDIVLVIKISSLQKQINKDFHIFQALRNQKEEEGKNLI